MIEEDGGIKTEPHMTKFLIKFNLFIFVISIFIPFFFIFLLGGLIYTIISPIVFRRTPYGGKTYAYHAIRDFITRDLKTPSTANFPIKDNDKNLYLNEENKSWIEKTYVDAENEYGAKVRYYYTVEVKYNEDNKKWYLVNISSLQ